MRFDLKSLDAPTTYKLLGGLIVPRPIALVTTRSADGRNNAAPFSFFNAVSEDPPLIVLGIGVNPSGNIKDTTANIRDVGEFVVNLVDEEMAEAMNLSATNFPPEVDEADVAGFELLPGEVVAPARLAAAPVSMECRRYITLQPGKERYVILGEVLMIHVADDLIDPESLRIDRERYAPIGRLFGSGYCRTNDRFEIKRMTVAEGQALLDGHDVEEP